MRLFDSRYVTMTRGDTVSFNMEIEGLDQDLDTAFLTCRKSYTGEILFQKSLGNGITKQDTGLYVLRIAPEDTKDVEPAKYYYDLELGVNGDKFTILKGVLDIEPDMTY